MPLVLAGATSGSTTIQATDAVTQTITLPNATGTVLTTNGSGIASVNGIQFPATQSASANANTLDDYEEGTWTPNQGSGLSVNGTFSSSGIYVKIGSLVYVNCRLQGSTQISCSAGGLVFTNLPFSIAASPGNAMGSSSNGAGATTINIAYGTESSVYLGNLAITNGGAIFVTLTYTI
jgi:hypothetical protein